MSGEVLLPLLVLAIGIGWVLGHYKPISKLERFFSSKDKINTTYLQAINYLMNADSDRAIDLFTESLEVGPETFETHINLGRMLRRQGEVDRAIRIHQNLLSQTDISPLMLDQARFELARDFYKSGLLCRAENLLQDMVEDKTYFRHECLLLLVDIYRDEKEWAKAIEAASLLKRKLFSSPSQQDKKLAIAQSHFSCELALESVREQDTDAARQHLRSALSFHKGNARATLVLASIAMEAGDYNEAIRLLKKIPQQDARYISESVPVLSKAYEATGELEDYRLLLTEYMQNYNSVTVMQELARLLGRLHGDKAAAEFLGHEMKRRPSLRGLIQLIDFHLPHASGSSSGNLELLRKLMQNLLQGKPGYRCEKCGFSGKNMHWMCPQCKNWETISLIQGVEGD